MTPADALELALKKENASIRLYSRLANQHAVIRDMLLDLLNEEYKHKKIIEKKIAAMMR
jgi:rubrerythrin